MENIDDETDDYGILMVKLNDPALAKRYGIKTFPSLVYFRNGNPLTFDGKLIKILAASITASITQHVTLVLLIGAIHKLRYAIEVGGWSAKYNYCNLYLVDN